MLRGFTTVTVLAGVVCCSLPLPGHQNVLPGEAVPPREGASRPAHELREKLARPMNLPKGIDPNTPLKESLEFLSEFQDVTILVDRAAFKAEGVSDLENFPTGLPRLTNLPFRMVLTQLLGNLDPPTTFVQRGGHLVLVPRHFTRPTQWGPAQRHVVPLVNLHADRRPLEVALHELTEQSGVNIVLDRRDRARAETLVSISLTQVPVDTAVYLLADLAELKALPLDTVLYVTTKENAKELQSDLKKTGMLERFQGHSPGPGAP